MMKILAAALVVTGAAWLTTPGPANAATPLEGITNATQTDMSAQRRRYRRAYRSMRVYPAPRYYSYYGPTYYERPYYRPAPLFFGIGGHW